MIIHKLHKPLSTLVSVGELLTPETNEEHIIAGDDGEIRVAPTTPVMSRTIRVKYVLLPIFDSLSPICVITIACV